MLLRWSSSRDSKRPKRSKTPSRRTPRQAKATWMPAKTSTIQVAGFFLATSKFSSSATKWQKQHWWLAALKCKDFLHCQLLLKLALFTSSAASVAKVLHHITQCLFSGHWNPTASNDQLVISYAFIAFIAFIPGFQIPQTRLHCWEVTSYDRSEVKD